MSETKQEAEALAAAVQEQQQASQTKTVHVQSDSEALLQLVMQLNENAVEQTAQLKKQLRLTRWCGGVLAAMLVAVCIAGAVVVPKVSTALTQANGALTQASDLLNDLRPTVTSLSQADLGGTLQEANALIKESRQGLAEGLEQLSSAQQKIEAFDIETLNRAIQDLQSIVQPLANLFGR